MNNIIYEILNGVDIINLYKYKLYLLNLDILIYIEKRKNAIKSSITDLPGAIFDSLYNREGLNWLYFLFGKEILYKPFAWQYLYECVLGSRKSLLLRFDGRETCHRNIIDNYLDSSTQFTIYSHNADNVSNDYQKNVVSLCPKHYFGL